MAEADGDPLVAQRPGNLETVLSWQEVIHQDYVERSLRTDGTQGRRPVSLPDYGKSLRLVPPQVDLDKSGKIPVVIDKEDTD